MKISTQKIHSALRVAGYISEKYSPSNKIDRSGYYLTAHPLKMNWYCITIWNSGKDTISYSLEEMCKALDRKGITCSIAENSNTNGRWIEIKKFQKIEERIAKKIA